MNLAHTDGGRASDTKFHKMLIAGEECAGIGAAPVYDKYTGKVIAHMAQAGREDVARAVSAAQAAFAKGGLTPHARYTALMAAAEGLLKRSTEVLDTIVAESGFTYSDSQRELDRAVQTLRHSAEEAHRMQGEMVPIHGAPGQDRRLAFTMRFPLGVVCAITPFNSPLNTVTHKVAPALAAGNAVILKPASATPLTSVLLVQILIEAGFPPSYLSILHGPGGSIGQWLTEEQGIRFYTFTGSTSVGMKIQAGAGLRRTQMELGSIASTIICEDADVEAAIPKVVAAAYRKAGQVCTSIQRLYVHASIFESTKKSLLAAIGNLRYGDPHDRQTFVGPMIDERETIRAHQWVEEAVAAGATLLTGGKRSGPVLAPTLLTDVTGDMRVMREEIFAPVTCLIPFTNVDDALASVNNTPYGLATGVFTRDLGVAMKAARTLQVGGVHINETSSSRVDLMPYGGCKASGFGREGPRYAIQELTEERLVTISV